MPVPRLRMLELVGVALVVVLDTRNTIMISVQAGPELLKGYSTLPNAIVLNWMFHLVFYAVLIPNTARRSAIVIGSWIAVATIVHFFATWSRLPLPPGSCFNAGRELCCNSHPNRWASPSLTSARITAYRREAATARKVGNYLLVRRLGGGGMGDVFLAQHRLLKRLLHQADLGLNAAGDETFASRFEREVAATTRLNHPGAVQVYDYGRTDDGHFYYVMEYLPGLTLDEVVAADGPLSAARVVHVLRQVCGALKAAHLVGLVHRDVKPGNIMTCRFEDRADVIKLLDFGLVFDAESAEDQRLTQVGGILGTPAYMSPEQARGEPHLGPASDLYSLGGVAYFLLTGRPPFQGRGGLDVLNAHLTAAVVPPSASCRDVPPDLEAIVLKLLAKDPADRFADAGALGEALGACDGIPVWTDADADGWWDRRDNEHGLADAARSPSVVTGAEETPPGALDRRDGKWSPGQSRGPARSWRSEAVPQGPEALTAVQDNTSGPFGTPVEGDPARCATRIHRTGPGIGVAVAPGRFRESGAVTRTSRSRARR